MSICLLCNNDENLMYWDYKITCRNCGFTDFTYENYICDDFEEFRDKTKQIYKRKTHLKQLLNDYTFNERETIIMYFEEYEKRYNEIRELYGRSSIINYKYLIYRICKDLGYKFKKPKMSGNRYRFYNKIWKIISE